MNIEKITIDKLDDLVELFDQYRVFQQQPSAPEKYRAYLYQRLSKEEATVFVAYNNRAEPIGFVLNYHSFSSVSLAKIIVLNDLYVCRSHRQQGVANQLIASVVDLANGIEAARIDLATAVDNLSAQALYEKLGFIKDTEYFSYSLTVN